MQPAIWPHVFCYLSTGCLAVCITTSNIPAHTHTQTVEKLPLGKHLQQQLKNPVHDPIVLQNPEPDKTGVDAHTRGGSNVKKKPEM